MEVLGHLKQGTKVTFYHDREKKIINCFSEADGTPYMSQIEDYFKWLNLNYYPEHWRLFIDSNSTDKTESLKAFLLYSKNGPTEDDLLPILDESSDSIK